MKKRIGSQIMTSWLNDCEICNNGLIARVQELKKTGHSEREAAQIMSEEATAKHPELADEFSVEHNNSSFIP